MPITRNCDTCGISYTRPPSQIGSFCSKACAYVARTKPLEERVAKYRMMYRPGHPLAVNSPYIPEHRVLLWEKLGSGPQRCHYCSKTVLWLPGGHTKVDALVTDHIDRDTSNNSFENLVPACHSCNMKNTDRSICNNEPHYFDKQGKRHRAYTRPCGKCEKIFTTSANFMGRFCSRNCAGR